MRFLKFILFVVIITSLSACIGTPNKFNATASAPFLRINATTVDSLLSTMTLDEKIGQLIWIATSENVIPNTKKLEESIANQHIGGLIFDKMSLDSSYFIARNQLTDLAKFPLLFGTHPNSFSLRDHDLMAIGTDSIAQEYIQELSTVYQAFGYDFCFEANLQSLIQRDSILHNQSFENQINRTLERNEFLINQFQEKGILTGVNQLSDLHLGKIDTSLARQERLFPYQSLAQSNASMMLLDTNTFSLNSLKNLSDNSIRNYLGDSLNFGGLAISYFTNIATLNEQLRTGTDAFIVAVNDANTVHNTLKNAIRNNVITEGVLNYTVKKILLAKEWTKRFSTPLDQNYVENNTSKWLALDTKRLEHSVSILKNEAQLLPITNLKKENILLIHVNIHPLSYWLQDRLEDYANVEEHYFFTTNVPTTLNSLYEKRLDKQSFDAYDKIVVLPNFTGDYTYMISELKQVANRKNTILVHTGDPKYIDLFKDYQTVIHSPDAIKGIEIVADVIYGARPAFGQFPVNRSKYFQFGQGEKLTKSIRLKHSSEPAEVGCNSKTLAQIDEIVAEGIKGKAMPSCQVMVIKNGSIVYDKHFGHHTYSKKVAINDQHLYDLASITKVVSTTMAMMKLYQQGKYSLNDSLYQVFGSDTLSTVNKVTLRELLIHQSGIQPFMPIIRYLKNKDDYDYFSTEETADASTKIANDFYVFDQWLDTLWRAMTTLELQDNQTYRYSDVNANILQRVVETLTEKPLDEYVHELYYDPLNMERTLYNPLDKYEKEEIVPTEKDARWRKQLVHGYVHDESAAFLGGVAGNAGLFSTAHDLGVLSQMLLNGGQYGGKQFLQQETIDLFTASTHGNHRGLGFNKQTETGTTACSKYASFATYGHTGFTGNCFWVDPENDLIYIFLSNRVYPRRNSRLSKMQIRERIHDVIYESFK